jgi:hypothetical protein
MAITQQGWRAGSSGTSGALTELPIQNTLYVAKNGDDSTGTRNRLDKPYLTIAGASADAQAGDCVYVFSGTYNEPVTWVKDQVYYYFEPNAGVQETGTSNSAIGDNNEAKRIYIYGHGTFSGYRAIYLQNLSSSIHLECSTLEGQLDGAYFSGGVNVYIRAERLTASQQYGMVFVGEINYDVEIDKINFNTSLNAGSLWHYLYNGTGYFKCKQMQTNGNNQFVSGINFYQSPDCKVFAEIENFQHTAEEEGVANTGAILFNGGGYLQLKNSNINTNSNGVIFWNEAEGSKICQITNCRIDSEYPCLQANGSSVYLDVQDSFLYKSGNINQPIANVGNVNAHENAQGEGALSITNTRMYNNAEGNASHGIVKEGNPSELLLDDVGIVLSGEQVYSIYTTTLTGQNINIQSTAYSNRDVVGGGLITNIITGTNLIYDTDIKFLDQVFTN